MRLAETFQCDLESDEVPHTEQWGDRQPCELRVDAEQAREVLLNVSGDSCFGLRIHLKGSQSPRKDNANVISAYGQFVKRSLPARAAQEPHTTGQGRYDIEVCLSC